MGFHRVWNLRVRLPAPSQPGGCERTPPRRVSVLTKTTTTALALQRLMRREYIPLPICPRIIASSAFPYELDQGGKRLSDGEPTSRHLNSYSTNVELKNLIIK